MSGQAEGDNVADRFKVGEAEVDSRLDSFLAEKSADLSRSRIKKLIGDKQVTVNGYSDINPSLRLKEGDVIGISVPPPVDDTPQPQDIPLNIIYEDDDVIVINKPAGMVVHPAAGNWDGTLVNALLFHCGDSLSGIGGVKRPGIVHRLDKDTSGVMMAAKNDKAHRGLADQLADRSLSRLYHAFVWGVPQPIKGSVDQPIDRHKSNRLKMTVHKDGRSAKTHYLVQENHDDAIALVTCKLESGRTHQIRVHMQYMKHPVVGDPLYFEQPTKAESLMKRGQFSEEKQKAIMAFDRQALHAYEISFIHPVKSEKMTFTAPYPEDFENLKLILNQ